MTSCANACRDARLVRPLKNAGCIRSNNHAICLPFILRGRTNQCILIYIPNGADARTVRPYMPVMAILMRKMVEMASFVSACRDARLVRPLKNAAYIRSNNHAICLPFILRGRTDQCISTYIPNGADARAVRPYMPLACKSFFDIANPKVQCLKFKLQSQPILKFNIQTSMFKVKVPTCLS